MSESLTFTFECDALAPGVSRVVTARLVEQLGAPYAGTVSLQIDDPDFDLTTLPGLDAMLVIERAPERRAVPGLIADVRFGGVHDGEQRADLLFTPALTLLSLRRNSRIFQSKTAPEILETVLGEALADYGRSMRLELSETYARREYCVQYQETDLDFAHRLMEEEGITYAFDFEGATEVVVLRDRNDAYPNVGSAFFDPSDRYVREREPVHELIRRHTATTTSVVLTDWDWTKSGDMRVTEEVRSEDPVGRDRESYEHGLPHHVSLTDYAGRAYGANDAAQGARVRQEAHAVDARTVEGVSRKMGLTAGGIVQIVGHSVAGMDGEYLVTRVVHENRAPERFRGSTATAESYHNRFQGIPVEVPHRPKRTTPKPRIAGVQTAVVTGPAGEEIHVDEHGRIKVQFHWDRENPADDTSSCWVRCQQAWAGNQWGFWWVPRIGMEVVVLFIDGDPDRPLVTGCVYNGTNATPYPLPDEKTKSTIKSNSSLGGGGFNEFRFEDKAGSEEIYTHAQKDYNEVVENDHNTLVHNNQTNTVDVDQTQVVGANQTETVHGNQEMTVDGNRTVHVKSNFDETVDGTETRHVAGNVTETFDSNEDRTVSGNLTETISGNETRTISGSQTETVSGSRTSTVSGSVTQTITGSLTQTVTGGITSSTPAAYDITAVGGMTITAAAGVTFIAPGGMQVMAPGGVVQVDSQFQWVGVKKLDASGFASAATILKMEATGLSYAATGAKIEGTLVELSKTTVEDKNRGAAARAAATRIGNAAVAVLKALPHVMI
jgi:type VI secretion system secreted protein VgrG